LLAHERYHEWVSSQVDFVSCVLYNVLLLMTGLIICRSIFSKGAIGKCNSLFQFVEGVMKFYDLR